MGLRPALAWALALRFGGRCGKGREGRRDSQPRHLDRQAAGRARPAVDQHGLARRGGGTFDEAVLPRERDVVLYKDALCTATISASHTPRQRTQHLHLRGQDSTHHPSSSDPRPDRHGLLTPHPSTPPVFLDTTRRRRQGKLLREGSVVLAHDVVAGEPAADAVAGDEGFSSRGRGRGRGRRQCL